MVMHYYAFLYNVNRLSCTFLILKIEYNFEEKEIAHSTLLRPLESELCR